MNDSGLAGGQRPARGVDGHQDRQAGSARTRREFLGAVGGAVGATVLATGTARAADVPTIAMANNYFAPVGLAIEPGTRVRFAIEAGSHSATAYPDRIPAGVEPFDTETISDGAVEHTFETPGTYDYYCVPHRSMGMTGRIVVGEPGGPATASPIPDGSVPGSEEIRRQGRIDAGSAEEGGSKGRSGPARMRDRRPVHSPLVPAGLFAGALAAAGTLGYWFSR